MTTEIMNMGAAPTLPNRPDTKQFQPDNQAHQDALKLAAKSFEASFIAEMLKSTGLGKSRKSFGGGAGEDTFSSFLVNAQANKIADSGGFGLATRIYDSLASGSRSDD